MGGLWIKWTHLWHAGISGDNFLGWEIVLKFLPFALEASAKKLHFRKLAQSQTWSTDVLVAWRGLYGEHEYMPCSVVDTEILQ